MTGWQNASGHQDFTEILKQRETLEGQAVLEQQEGTQITGNFR